MRANAIHFVEKSFALAVQVAFNSKRRKTVGDDANVPARSIAATVASINQNFRRRFAFGAGAERAILGAGDQDAFAQEIGWAFPAIGGNDDPAARDGIFTQLRQSWPPRRIRGLNCTRRWEKRKVARFFNRFGDVSLLSSRFISGESGGKTAALHITVGG